MSEEHLVQELPDENAVISATAHRKQCEQTMLMLLFNGFSPFVVAQSYLIEIDIIKEKVDSSNYVHPVKGDPYLFADLTAEYESTCRVLSMLDALAENGLVERSPYFTFELSPEDGPQKLSQNILDKTPAWSPVWFAEVLCNIDKSRSLKLEDEAGPRYFLFEYLEYRLTEKGYGVALSFQKHEDDNQQAALSRKIAEEAATTAKGSLKTARIALFAAFLIALGSIGNLVFNGYVWYDKHNNQQHPAPVAKKAPPPPPEKLKR